MESFLQMMKLHPEDTVALYYKNIVHEAIDRGEEVVIPYNYQVPLSEMHRRISYLNSCFRKPAQQLEQLWQGDDYFSSMLLWGMNAGSTTIKRAIFDIKMCIRDREYGVKVSGATVHFVDEGADTGPIIAQRSVPVLPGDTPEMLQQRVLEVEHEILPEAVALFCQDRLKVQGRRVSIL